MRVQCDVCERAPASVLCCADEAALCVDCDQRVHAANKLATKHQRVPLISDGAERPRCDICQEKNGFFFCLEDRAFLCRDCDVSIHSATKLASAHRRFLVPGTKVSLETISGDSPAPSSDTVSEEVSHSLPLVSANKLYQPPKSVTPPSACGVNSGRVSHPAPAPPVSKLTYPSISYIQQQAYNQGGGTDVLRRSSISEYLTEGVPGWRVEELLNIPELADGYSLGDVSSSKADVPNIGDFDWTADFSLFDEQVHAESLREVPQLPSPPTASGMSRAGRMSGLVMKGKGKQEMALVPEFDDAFVVPDLGLRSAPVSPPVAKRRRIFNGL